MQSGFSGTDATTETSKSPEFFPAEMTESSGVFPEVKGRSQNALVVESRLTVSRLFRQHVNVSPLTRVDRTFAGIVIVGVIGVGCRLLSSKRDVYTAMYGYRELYHSVTRI